MKVSLSGLGEYSDTLHIDLPKRVQWEDVTGLLNVDGASYYYVSGSTVGVRYSRAVEVRDFTAQCLRVIMKHFDISIEELAIGIHDTFIKKDTRPELANDIWSRVMTTSIPQSVPQECVEPRGTGPAYWLR